MLIVVQLLFTLLALLFGGLMFHFVKEEWRWYDSSLIAILILIIIGLLCWCGAYYVSPLYDVWS